MSNTKTTNEKISSLGAGITSQVEDLVDEARPALDRMSHRVKDEWHDLTESGKEALTDAKHKLETEAKHVRLTTEHMIHHDPIRSVLIAAGTGAAIALAASWFIRSRSQ